MITKAQVIVQNIDHRLDQWSLTSRATCKKLAKAKRLATTMQNTKQNYRHIAIAAFLAVAMRAEGSSLNKNCLTFDTDSGPIGVDNRCTGCISHHIEDFEGPLRDSNRAIKGFGGSCTTNIKIGTIMWKWDDDTGRTHKFTIPNLFYVPEGNIRLLSPQHWAQAQKYDKGTGCETVGDKVTLCWSQRKNSLAIPLGCSDNVTTFHLSHLKSESRHYTGFQYQYVHNCTD
jgi:hypothetical protein